MVTLDVQVDVTGPVDIHARRVRPALDVHIDLTGPVDIHVRRVRPALDVQHIGDYGYSGVLAKVVQVRSIENNTVNIQIGRARFSFDVQVEVQGFWISRWMS
jgi:hypothetical protein